MPTLGKGVAKSVIVFSPCHSPQDKKEVLKLDHSHLCIMFNRSATLQKDHKPFIAVLFSWCEVFVLICCCVWFSPVWEIDILIFFIYINLNQCNDI